MAVLRRFRPLSVLAIVVCLAVPFALAGGDFWVKKPYQQWSAEETRRITEESPWATTLTLGSVQTAVTSGDAPSNRGYRGEMETDPSISYNLQFRSAQPIREAQVRSAELNGKYDAMSADKKSAIDANAAKFLAVTFPDRVIVSVTFHTNVQDYESQLRSYWERQSVPTLSMTTFLDAGKERLSLLNYSFKDDTFQFTFPRPKQVNPNEKIGVEFVHPKIQLIGQQRILQEFNLKKMLVNGEPSF
ncbi:MAG: hypothetical protein ABSA78_04405 [Candidatus Sulfotelmatobacter sp.]|jgi:hypothetical protein